MGISAVSSQAYWQTQRTKAAEVTPFASLEAVMQETTRNVAGRTVLGGQNISSTASAMAAQEVEPPVRIPVDLVKRLDMSGLKATHISELPEQEYQMAIEALERMLEGKYMRMPEPADLAGYPGMKPYATVVVGGKIVAKVDNQGALETSNELYERIKHHLPDEVNGTNGPDLAQARAEYVAKLLGGKVVEADTALTQMEFRALPEIERPKAWIDYEAMRQDPMYLSLQETKAKRAALIEQAKTA